MLPAGATVTITGFASLDGSRQTVAREIELATGERLTATTDISRGWQSFEIQPPTAR